MSEPFYVSPKSQTFLHVVVYKVKLILLCYLLSKLKVKQQNKHKFLNDSTIWHEHSRGLRAPFLVKAGVCAVMSLWIVRIKEHLWTTGTYPSTVLLPTAKGFKSTKLNLIWYDMMMIQVVCSKEVYPFPSRDVYRNC